MVVETRRQLKGSADEQKLKEDSRTKKDQLVELIESKTSQREYTYNQ